MCLSVLGTGLAAAAARLTRVNTADADKILRRLIEITKAVRSAEHVGQLDEYEEEADELLALGLAPDAVHVLSVNRMGALSLALNQMRHAMLTGGKALLIRCAPILLRGSSAIRPALPRPRRQESGCRDCFGASGCFGVADAIFSKTVTAWVSNSIRSNRLVDTGDKSPGGAPMTPNRFCRFSA